ncbi:MAG: efflux transporter outer membrane subunit [Cycloclasticus sp.]|nr:efflux transporter outer membrane subunit [Cycloclasticus sp.]
MVYLPQNSKLFSVVRLLAASCVIGVISGCQMLGPDFMRPDAPISEQWSEAIDNKTTAENVDYEQWWRIFNDDVLNSLIDTARKQNLPLQIAGIRIIEARARLGIAVGNSYPQQQQVRAGISHVGLSDNQPNISSGADTSYIDSNFGVDIGWEMDLWGRFQRGIEAAEADMQVSMANYDDVMVSLTASVASAYTQIRTFEQRLLIAKSNVEIQQDSLKIAKIRFQNGVTTELDVHQAHALLLNTQASIPALEIGLKQSKHALSTLLGMLPGSLEKALGGKGSIPNAQADVAIGIPAELLRRRPDIRRAELQTAAQSARIGIAEAELYPHFSLIGSIGLRSSDTFDSNLGDLFHTDSLETFVGPSLSWNILNYGRIKNNVRVQDARLQQLIVAYQNTVLEASREVEDALVGFIRAQEQVIYLGESVDVAKKSVDLALVQYRDGAADYQRVLDTQKVLVGQQDVFTTRRGDVAVSLITLYKALGGGWQTGHKKNFVAESNQKEMSNRTDWGELIADDLADPDVELQNGEKHTTDW